VEKLHIVKQFGLGFVADLDRRQRIYLLQSLPQTFQLFD
jgi:hypothetical protein